MNSLLAHYAEVQCRDAEYEAALAHRSYTRLTFLVSNYLGRKQIYWVKR